MTFVEWLRVRNIARVLAIVLGVLILITLVLRISFNSQLGTSKMVVIDLKGQAGTTDSNAVLPDGTKREIVANVRLGKTIVIDSLTNGGSHIVVTEPVSSSNKTDRVNANVGPLQFRKRSDGKTITETLDTDGPTPFIYLMFCGLTMGFIIATILGAPFARESDGHLEIALTKPVSRVTNALAIIGVDLAGIVLCTFMTVVALIVCQAMFEVPRFDFSGLNATSIVLGFIYPFAWYAMINAATASLSRGYGAVQGFVWPASLLVVGLGLASLGNSIIAQAVHSAAWVISRIVPITYLPDFHPDKVSGQLLLGSDFASDFAISVLLFAVYSVLAVLQWRRVEA